MFLAARIRTALVATAAAIAGSRAIAAEPAPTKIDCIAASESAQDLLHAGKLLNARAQFSVCESASCPGPIREDCAQHLDEIAKAMPSIIFEVKDDVGHDVTDVIITMDGHPLMASAGSAIELDPGAHSFTFQAEGLQKADKRFVVVEGLKHRRELIRMGSAKTQASTTSAPAQSRKEVSLRSNGPPTLAWAAFGVGGAGLTIGVIAGLVAGSKHSTLEGECNNTAGTCTQKRTRTTSTRFTRGERFRRSATSSVRSASRRTDRSARRPTRR